MPESPALWGWRPKAAGRELVPQGTRIGWIAMRDLFLDPLASYQVAQQMAGNDPLPLSQQALRHQLHQRGMLSSIDGARKMLMVRRTLAGMPRQVLHLRTNESADG